MLEHRGPVWRHAPAALGTALLAVATVVGTQVALADAGNPRAPLSPYGEGGFTVGVAAVDKRITITSADDGSYVLGYTPAGGDVVLDLDLLSGDEAQPWWYDAGTGRTLKMAALASAGVARFPAPKEGGGPAWVLVVDDIAAGYGSPDREVVAQATGEGGDTGAGGASASGASTSGSTSSGSGSSDAATSDAATSDAATSDAATSDAGSSGSGASGSGSTGSSGGGSSDGASSDGSGGSSSGDGASGSDGAGDAQPGDDPASGSSPEQGRFGSSSGSSSGGGSGGDSGEKGSGEPGSDAGSGEEPTDEGTSGGEKSDKDPGSSGSSGSGKDDETAEDSEQEKKTGAEEPEKPPKAEAPKKAPEAETPKEAPKEAPEKAPRKAPAEAPKASADPSWDKLAQCESTGNWGINSGNGYYGGLQFDKGTWSDFGGTEYAPRADQATKEQQIEVATKVRDARGGYSSWPACSSKLGLPK